MVDELRKISFQDEIWGFFKRCGAIIYSISNKGRFASAISISPKRNKGKSWKVKIIAPYTNKNGYMLVRTRENGKTKAYQIHRAVLSVFKPIEKENIMQVNHIDGDKSNNILENLEWCTCKENINHALKYGLINNNRKVFMYSFDGDFIKEFPSITQAEKETGIFTTNICYCCSGKVRQAGGYQWRYNKADRIDKVRDKKVSSDLKTRNCKPIQMIKNGKVIKVFTSVLEASNYLGIINGQNNISACALGKRKSAYGYNWKYFSN